MQLIREDYLKLIRPYYEVDLIKVITGARRAGKSVLMEIIKDELVANGIRLVASASAKRRQNNLYSGSC